MRTDRQADLMTLLVAFRNLGKRLERKIKMDQNYKIWTLCTGSTSTIAGTHTHIFNLQYLMACFLYSYIRYFTLYTLCLFIFLFMLHSFIFHVVKFLLVFKWWRPAERCWIFTKYISSGIICCFISLYFRTVRPLYRISLFKGLTHITLFISRPPTVFYFPGS